MTSAPGLTSDFIWCTFAQMMREALNRVLRKTVRCKNIKKKKY